MIIGAPREIKEQENRVGLLPSGAYQLVKRGHQVLVQRGAGIGSGYRDEDYRAAGAEMLEYHAEVFRRAERIVKVKEPLPPEYGLLRRGCILLAEHGLDGACQRMPGLRAGINIMDGRLLQPAVAAAHGLTEDV